MPSGASAAAEPTVVTPFGAVFAVGATICCYIHFNIGGSPGEGSTGRVDHYELFVHPYGLLAIWMWGSVD
jgi:hypothetical protein